MFAGLFSSGLDARWFIDTDHLRTKHRNVCGQEQNPNVLQLRLTCSSCGDGVDPPPLIIYYGKNPSIMADISATDPFCYVNRTSKKDRRIPNGEVD